MIARSAIFAWHSSSSALAEAVERRWEVPSPRRREHVAPDERLSRIVPPEPRWADDWFPTARHAARISATFYRDGRRPSARVAQPRVMRSSMRRSPRSSAIRRTITRYRCSPYRSPLTRCR